MTILKLSNGSVYKNTWIIIPFYANEYFQY